MSVTGKIVNGVVILPPGTTFPEGAAVKVETIEPDALDIDTSNMTPEEIAEMQRARAANRAFANTVGDEQIRRALAKARLQEEI